MYRILCLDGGGIKGVFTAAALARIEEQTKKKIVDHFDLICGTSTGGIIRLGMGLSTAELLNFYRERGPVIFPATSRLSVRSASSTVLRRAEALARYLETGTLCGSGRPKVRGGQMPHGHTKL